MDGLQPLVPLLILILIFLSAVFSGSETGLYSLSRIKLRYRLRRREARARALDQLLRSPAPAIITILIGNNIAAQLMVSFSERSLELLVGETWSIALSILVLTPVVLVTGEFLPKYLFRRNADRWMDHLAFILVGLRWLFAIPVLVIQAATTLFRLLIPGGTHSEIWEPHTSRPNLRTFFKAEGQGHSLTPVQQALLDRVLALEKMTLTYEGVTKPLVSIEALDGGATVAAIRNGLGPKYFQRYLVTDHEAGEPIGYVTAVDLVIADEQTVLRDLVKPLPALSPDTPLHEALQRMHDAGADLALVGDREGIAFRNDCLRVLAKLD